MTVLSNEIADIVCAEILSSPATGTVENKIAEAAAKLGISQTKLHFHEKAERMFQRGLIDLQARDMLQDACK